MDDIDKIVGRVLIKGSDPYAYDFEKITIDGKRVMIERRGTTTFLDAQDNIEIQFRKAKFDASALKKHVVIHHPDASDPFGYVGLGRYITFELTDAADLYSDRYDVGSLVNQCVDTASRIMYLPDAAHCKGSRGQTFLAGDVKRDLMALLGVASD